MPIYEYRCLDCHEEYEKREGFDAPALQKCPSCGGSARRVLHAAPIVFKGSGFYVTDSRKPAAAEKSAPEAEREASVDTKASTDGKADGAKKEAKASKDDGKSATADRPATAGGPAEPAAAS